MTAAELFTFQFSAENFQRKEILASTIYGRGGNENFQFKFQSDRLSSPALSVSVSDQATWATGTGRPTLN